jgi:hypothetical protein
MHKRYLHHVLKRLRAVPAAAFLISGIVLLVIAVFALRANNLRMLELREAVFAADEQNGDVEAALRDLREHVYAHMNTDLTASNNGIYPPIQLKYRYDRLVGAEKDRVSAVNAQVAIDAQNYCEQRFPGSFSGGPRVPCISEYIDANGASEQPISEALYQFDFESPGWSPDLAGWSIVLGLLSLVMGVSILAFEYGLRAYLHRHA